MRKTGEKDTVARKSGNSFPRSAWECRPGRSAALCLARTTRSVEEGIPTQSVGTSLSALFRPGAKHAARFPCYSVHLFDLLCHFARDFLRGSSSRIGLDCCEPEANLIVYRERPRQTAAWKKPGQLEMGAPSVIRMAIFWLSWEGSSRKNTDGNAMAKFHRAFVLPRSAAPSPRGAELAGMPSKGDELYEARDLRIVPVDSPDPEVRTNPRRFARIETLFILASRRRRARRPKTE